MKTATDTSRTVLTDDDEARIKLHIGTYGTGLRHEDARLLYESYCSLREDFCRLHSSLSDDVELLRAHLESIRHALEQIRDEVD